MQLERGKPPETPNAPYRAARIKDERWRSAGPGFEPGRAGPRLSLTSSEDEGSMPYIVACPGAVVGELCCAALQQWLASPALVAPPRVQHSSVQAFMFPVNIPFLMHTSVVLYETVEKCRTQNPCLSKHLWECFSTLHTCKP
jgi:hypothetical protein